MTIQNKTRIYAAALAPAFVLAFLVGLLALAGCTTTGSPPTALEQKLFNVTTNYVPVVIPVTNVQEVLQYRTNQVSVIQTNILGVTVPVTNYEVVPIRTFVTNTVLATNMQANYQYGTGAGAQQVISVGTGIGTPFGVGGLIGTGLSLLFGLWASMRSGRNYATAANMSQTIETMRSFIQQLPNGTNYDAALVNWMQTHQMQAGVAQQVLTILKNDVNSESAQFAAQQMLLALGALQTSTGTTPPPPPAATPLTKPS